ncbi:phosphatidylinositol glycan, class T [Schistosoma bovis]|uniref:Phosphatidylinositol glycan, class T n=1 Tax=Schistosoma bovis TaxID=6184 RepID=A0A430QND2_SCHBO|nr:phosphatidylinositol glycan, class T [Schistosoma bovis]
MVWKSNYQVILILSSTFSVDQSWFKLTHALSGLFCASLNRLSTNEHFASPIHSYKPSGVPKFSRVSKEVRYSQLPGEALCSENLTPWTKYLPCKSFSGLGSLLRSTSLFKSNYNTMTIGVRRVCLCLSHSYVLFNLDIYIFSAPWSIRSILGSEFKGFCDAANTSRVFILASYEDMNIPLDNKLKVDCLDNRVLAAYSTKDLSTQFISFPFKTSGKKSSPEHSPLVSATKHITGSGSVRGGVKVFLTSRADFNLKIVYFDLIPWYTQVFFSSLKIYGLDPKTQNKTEITPNWLAVKPSLARKRMGSIELVITLPAFNQLIITYQFRKVLQRWNEFPPDANHGFFVPAATVSYVLNSEQIYYLNKTKHTAFHNLNLPNWASSYNQFFNTTHSAPQDDFVRLHTPVSLVTMPTPDFSMPFNVLCLLGAGTGLCGITAAILGALHVRFTDKDTTYSDKLHLNAQLNGIKNYDFTPLDWNYPLNWSGGIFDTILASDCLYDKEDEKPLAFNSISYRWFLHIKAYFSTLPHHMRPNHVKAVTKGIALKGTSTTKLC